MRNTNPRQFRAELKDHLDLANREPIRIQRRSGENFILLREEKYQALQEEIVSLQRRLLGMSQVVSGETTDYKIGTRSRLNRFKSKKGPVPLKKYKDLVQQALYPDFNSGDDVVRIRDAKKAISDFAKATRDPNQTLDLMVHFGEVGTRMMNDFGMDYEAFYNSMESMYRKVFTRLTGKDHQLLSDFLPRLRSIENASRDTGYGYGDSLLEMMNELEKSAINQPKGRSDGSTRFKNNQTVY